MNNQSTASSILKSFTPRVKWAMNAVGAGGKYIGDELTKDVDKIKKDTVKSAAYMANDSIAAKVLRGKFSEVPKAAIAQYKRMASGEIPVSIALDAGMSAKAMSVLSKARTAKAGKPFNPSTAYIERNIKILNKNGVNVKSSSDIVTLYHGVSGKSSSLADKAAGNIRAQTFLATDRNAAKLFAGEKGKIIEVKVPVSNLGFVQDGAMAGSKGVTVQTIDSLVKGSDGISRAARQPQELMSTNDVRAIPNTAWTKENIALAGRIKRGEPIIKGKAANAGLSDTALHDANPQLFNNAQRAKTVDEFIAKMSKGKPETINSQVLTDFYNKVHRVTQQPSLSKTNNLDAAISVNRGGNMPNKTDIKFTPPRKMTGDYVAETKGGWPIPGMKATFDRAMASGDARTVKALLSSVPLQYQQTFAAVIERALNKLPGIPPLPKLPNLGVKEETKKIDFDRWANVKKDMIPTKVPKNAA